MIHYQLHSQLLPELLKKRRGNSSYFGKGVVAEFDSCEIEGKTICSDGNVGSSLLLLCTCYSFLGSVLFKGVGECAGRRSGIRCQTALVKFNQARHGTRGPTKKRIKELEKLAERLHEVAAQAGNTAPAWMRDWKSPWEGKKVGGELLPIGEEEMYYLAQRYRNNYTEIFEDDYHPEMYRIITTQVGRSSASAVAFGIGSFAGRGTLGPGKQRAFAVVSDIHLRFHDTCMAYKQSKKYRMPAVEKLQAEVYELVAKAVKERLGLAVTAEDVSSLWLLCKNEASLLDIVDRACGLFTPEEIELLEWADDLLYRELKMQFV